jgi:hypothetical protein
VAMLDSIDLGLASMLNSIPYPFFLAIESCLTHVFFFRAPWFFRRREGKEGGKTPLLDLLCGPSQHTCLATMPGWQGTLKDALVKWLSILFWGRTRHLNSVGGTHSLARAQHASAITLFQLLQHVFEMFQRKWKDEEALNCMLNKFFW